MRVALVTAFPPSKVTLNEYGYHLAKNFVQNAEVSELILLSDKTSEPKQLDFDKKEKIKVKDCWEFNSYTTLFSIFKAVRQEKPDAILFNVQFVKFGDKKIPSALGLLTPMILRFFGYKTVVLLHNILEQVDLEKAGFTDSNLMKHVYNFIGTNITKCILKANKVAVTINKYVTILNTKYQTKNVVLIPHGTFVTIKNPDFELKNGSKIIMAFGKFGTYKKVEILIEAVEIVRKTNAEKLEIVIAGTDSPNTIGYLAGVKEKYKNIEGLVFTGYVEENEVERIFTDSTIVVFPYTSTTGSSGVLHQAGSYGKAVIMPDLGDLALLIEDEGYRGEIFNPESATSLATAIDKIISNDNYRKELAMANFEAASALSMDKIINSYMDCFKSMQ